MQRAADTHLDLEQLKVLDTAWADNTTSCFQTLCVRSQASLFIPEIGGLLWVTVRQRRLVETVNASSSLRYHFLESPAHTEISQQTQVLSI